MLVKVFQVFAAIAIMCAMTGCTSIRSVLLHRDESNVAWQKTRHLPGVPITLHVPTHLRVTVVEKHYLTVNTVGTVNQVVRVDLPVPLREVAHEFLYTDRIFTVDMKRPAAGRMKLTAEFDADKQYFKKIEHEVEDETIKEVANLIGKIAPGGIFKPAAADRSALDDKIKEISSVVAVRVFEIDAPDFEQQVAAFLECHVNKAHDALVVPPGVNELRRLPLTVPSGQIGYEGPLCPLPGCQVPGEQLPVIYHPYGDPGAATATGPMTESVPVPAPRTSQRSGATRRSPRR